MEVGSRKHVAEGGANCVLASIFSGGSAGGGVLVILMNFSLPFFVVFRQLFANWVISLTECVDQVRLSDLGDFLLLRHCDE